MDKKTESENLYGWTDWIDEIENKIQELYYIGEFDRAKKAKEKLSVAKEQLKEDITYDGGKKWAIAYQLADIQVPIDDFLDEKGGHQEIKKRKINEFLDKSNKVIDNLQEKTSKQAFEELALVIQEYNKDEFNEIEKREISEEISKIVLKILEMQIKNAEEIDIEGIEEFCTQEDLIKAIKSELIEKAQIQDEEDRGSTLEMARKLMPEDLKMPNIWRKLTQVEHVKIANNSKDKEAESEEKLLPSVQEAKEKNPPFQAIIDFFSKISEREIGLYFYDTKFVLGEIDQKTGEYKNVKVKYCNLKDIDKMSKETKKQILEMKTRAKIIDKKIDMWFENLQKVELLDEVLEIMEGAFLGRKSLKELKIGKGLKNIPSSCFRNTGLEKLHTPSNIQKIGECAFLDCPIKETIFEEGLEEIERYAFYLTELEQSKIPRSTKKIGKKAFTYSKLKQMQILGDGTIEIDDSAFYCCDNPIVEVEYNKDVKIISNWPDCLLIEDFKIVRVENNIENDEKPTRKNARKNEFDKQYKVEQTPTINTRTPYQYNEIETPSNPKKPSDGIEY